MIKLRGTSIKLKLIMLLLVIGLIPLIAIGWFANQQSNTILAEKTFSALDAIRQIRKPQIEAYFSDRVADVSLLVTSGEVLVAMEGFRDLFQKFEKDGRKIGGRTWQEALDPRLVAWIGAYTKEYDYYDVNFIDPDGNVVYTVAREPDLGGNLIHGELKDSPLGRLFSKAQQGYAIQDFEPYAPSAYKYTAFVGAPIRKEDRIIGILALQLSTTMINAIMKERAGMGETGEGYLVGKHQGIIAYRNDRTFGGGKIGQPSTSPYIEKALSGHSGNLIALGPTGELRLASYTPLDIPGLNWAVIVSISQSEVDKPTQALNQTSIMLGLVLSSLVVGAALLTARFFANPLQELNRAANQIAAGEWSTRVNVQGGDEMGQLATSFNHMAQNNENQFWVKSSVAEFIKVIQNAETLEAFAQDLIQKLTPLLACGHGVVYVLNEKTKSYRLLGSYGYKERKDLSNEFVPGEGIVGQCVLEKQPILLTDVPADHIKITTGLGKSSPMAIMVVPLIFQDNVLGVIEVASHHAFTAVQEAFLDELVPPLSLGLENHNRKQRTELLLQQTQTQAQEMTALAEELREQREELQASNGILQEKTDALQASEEELREQREELQASNVVLQEKTDALQASEEEMRQQQEELQSTNRELEVRTELLEKQKIELETARRDVEAKARSLAVASRYKSEFLANMSHELRTPLNSLLLLAEGLADNREETLTGNQVKSARIIHASGKDLLKLINDILDLAKIEAGKMDFHVENLEVRAFADNMDQMFSHMAADKGLNWKVEIAVGTPASIQTDAGKVGQIVKNLLGNSMKFTEKGSVVLRFQPSPGMWALAIAVVDTGIGIPKEKRAMIFEAFQQADGATTRKYGGTGLGLSISRELAGRLGGEIRLLSQEGEGSTFSLYLPQRAPMATTAPMAIEGVCTKPVPAQEIEHTPVRDDRDRIAPGDRVILVIEDDPVFADILCGFSHKKGFKCVMAMDGESGLELAGKYQPTGILLDLTLLGGMDGWTVLDRLKENPKTSGISVHIMTGMPDKQQEGLARGAVDCLCKPVSWQQLDEVFQQVESFASLAGKRVLVVEGCAESLVAMTALVGGQVADLTTALSGAEAYTILQKQVFDCIVLNPDLPDMCGCDLLARIDADVEIVNPNVIIHTDQNLSRDDAEKLKKYTDSIVVGNGDQWEKRLMSEVLLFLRKVDGGVAEGARPSIPEESEQDAVLQGKTILVVDDDMRNTYALSRMLRQRGMKVEMAENGERALAVLDKKLEVNAVLMDVMMPGMDGYQAIKAIRGQERFRRLPIVALTAKTMAEDRVKCLQAGANEYLAKPVDVQALVALLRMYLQG